MMLNVFTLFLLLMFGEGAIHVVLLIGIISIIYDFIVAPRNVTV
jgi:hypothetical protein